MHEFTFGNISSSDYSIYVLDKPNRGYVVERDYEAVPVPGRNGDLHIDHGRYNNIEVVYQCAVMGDADAVLTELNTALMSKIGYQRLEDTFEPTIYRLASCNNGIIVTPAKGRDAARFDISFICKPQKFLLTGETEVEYTEDGTISNTTLYTAKPIIRIYGEGTVGIGSVNVTFDGSSSYVDIDCDIQDAYYGASNKNSSITLSPNRFPTLPTGSTGIVLGTGITEVDITPRWYEL